LFCETWLHLLWQQADEAQHTAEEWRGTSFRTGAALAQLSASNRTHA
jgi:hypothetical protein